MLFRRLALLVVATLLLGACATTRTAGEIPECDENDVLGGWNECTRLAAQDTWVYAQISSNAYDDEDAFILPGDIVLRHMEDNDGRGYAYAIYDRFDAQDRIVETIIAFRGTEGATNDWLFGNILGMQNGRALQTARSVANALGDARLTLVGHSLGGALAHHVTANELHIGGVEARRSRVFNNSPRFNGLAFPGDRRAVVEQGDPLATLRFLGTEPDQIYNSLNCQPGFGRPRDHSIRLLAECLTFIASFEDEAARRSVAMNGIGQPDGHRSDELPPGWEQADRRVPLHPRVDDPALARAVQASLAASDDFAVRYCTPEAGTCLPTAFNLLVRGDPRTGTVNVRWKINGVDQVAWDDRDIPCEAVDLADCAEAIVQLGSPLIGRPPVTDRDPRDRD